MSTLNKTDKQAIIIIGNNHILSYKVQNFMFGLGIYWCDGRKGAFDISSINVDECICVDNAGMSHSTLTFFKHQGMYEKFKFLDAINHFEDVENYFNDVVPNPDFYYKGRGYKI